MWQEVEALDFHADSRDALAMNHAEKLEHAKRLRKAIANSDEYSRRDVALATHREYRTVSNWLSLTKPTMPSERERAILRRMFPGYDSSGDPVEVAVRSSELVKWRQDAVISKYEQHLHEQRRERGAS